MNSHKCHSIYDDISRISREKCWCGSNLSRYSRQKNYALCKSCGTFVLTHVPDPRLYKEMYSLDNYWRFRQKEIKGHPTIEERTLNDLNDGRVNFWLDIVRQYTKKPGVAIEVGCGHGVLLNQLNSEGWKTIGVEIDEGTAHWVRKETALDIRVGIFPDIQLPPCDLFLAMDVIEHIYEPLSFAVKIKELLTLGGIAIIQTPLYDGIQDPPFAHRFYDVFDDIEHLFIFNRHSIDQLFEKAGLTVLSNQLAWQACHEILIVSKLSPPKNSNVSTDDPKSNHFSFPSNCLSLGNVRELNTREFRWLMSRLNALADLWGLRQFTNWSKIWEYPWVWFHGLSQVDWKDFSLLDIGSELSPMPWFLASLGANVMLTETDPQWVPQWERIRDETGLDVTWQIVSGENLPFENESFDVVTSFSAIEHQRDKKTAMDEVIRVLKPGGLLTISFDICEPEMGMTFPDWNGKALTMAQFEDLVWNRPEFDNGGQKPGWNLRDIPEFIKWHLQSAPHHNYVVGAAVLKKRKS